MNIVDKSNNGRYGVIYTVELEPNYLIDIAVSYETGAIYTMQNRDGSTVYSAFSHEDTYPDYKYDNECVVGLVKEVEKYIFEDDLMVDDQSECIDGYLWATDNLIDRFCQQKEIMPDIDVVDDINFYAIYHVNAQSIEIAGTYWVSFEKNISEEKKAFSLDLSPEDAEILMIAMNTYCKQRYGKSCLEYINDFRADENLPLLNIPENYKLPLSLQIRNASSKFGYVNSEVPNPIDRNR